MTVKFEGLQLLSETLHIVFQFSVSVAADEILNNLIFILSHNCWVCGISSFHFSQIIYFPAILLEIIENSVVVELI